MINRIQRATHLRIDMLLSLMISKTLRRLGYHLQPLYPTCLMIEPTNMCNLHCPTCPTGSGKSQRDKRNMSFYEFSHIIDQTKGKVLNITLWNYGEPFINPDVFDMIETASSVRLKVISSTNGEHFYSDEAYKRLVRSGLDSIIFSLDGLDSSTNSLFRKGSCFQSTVDAIRRLSKAKRKMGTNKPKIIVQMILMKQNENQRESMRKFARDIGADKFVEKKMDIDVLDPDFQSIAHTYLPVDPSLRRFEQNPDGDFYLKGDIINDCPWIHEMTVINSDGSVVPCCFDLYNNHVMGNAFEEDIGEIWESAQYREFRDQVRKSRSKIDICSVCPENRTSRVV